MGLRCLKLQRKRLTEIMREEDNETSDDMVMAVKAGDISDVEKCFVANPAGAFIRDDRGRTALHYEAEKNRITMMDSLLQQRCDLNAHDDDSNTALHLAVEAGSDEAVEWLVVHGANTSLCNSAGQAPLHLAAQLNRLAILQIIAKHSDRFDLFLRGGNGRLAIHIAAILNNSECAKILLSLSDQFCLMITCDNGFTPLHEAARNASAETLEVMLQWGEAMGYSRCEMMNQLDVEGNIPLHSAVHGGDIKTVRICLESGSRMNTRQSDLSTPVHLACSMGLLDIVMLMFNMQPEDKEICLHAYDAQKMMPLHYAAMFDHTNVVEYLINEGSNMNALDNEKRSPLLLAASRGAWNTVHFLIHAGADTSVKDAYDRNILHYVVMHEGCVDEFAAEMDGVKLCQLLNEPDVHGCTPLHYASRGGRLRSTESLIRLGACISTKNHCNESPLHFAARYGRYNTVVELLSGERGPCIINEPDGKGHTPLHIACENGHKRVVRLLLAKGALLQRDHHGRTPLHLAAMNGYTQTMELLLSIHSHLLDRADRDGNTSLHLAAKENRVGAINLLLNLNCKLLRNNSNQNPMDLLLLYKHSEAAMAMATHEERAYEILQLNSEKSEGVIQALIATMPEIYIAVLDRCVTKSSRKEESQEYYIKYSFKYLQFSREMTRQMESKNKNFKADPLPAMNTMVQYKRLELLCHPVCQKYIQMKWNAYGMYFHSANLVVYMAFVGILTIYAYLLMDAMKQNPRENRPKELLKRREEIRSNGFIPVKLTPSATFYLTASVVIVFVIVNCIKETLQFYQQRIRYVIDPINLLEWILYITAGIMVYPVFYGELQEYQLACAAIAAFLAWFNFLLYLQRFDRVGIYVVMFLEILKTLVKALLIFSILFIAFALAFYILMSRGNVAFSNIPMSLVRVFSMMLGEIDILDTFIEPYLRAHTWALETSATLPFPHFSFGFLLIFMISMPILLVNLLIGLAVGDIESVRRNAYLKRLAMQVELHTELERKLPKFLLERVDQEEVIEYPNSPSSSKCKWLWPLLQKWLGSVYTKSSKKLTEYSDPSQPEDYVCEEMYKQRQKLKDISASLENLQTLVRLIVQKMEIKTESCDWDEGTEQEPGSSKHKNRNKWTEPAFQRKIRTIAALMKKTKSV